MIEILVVLVLIAMLAGVVAMSIGQGNERRELANEAKRLHAVLRMAADEAVFQNVEVGVALDDRGYEFLGYSEEKRTWVGLPQTFLRPHTFPDWIVLEFNREEKSAQLPIAESKQGDEVVTPQFVLLSSGESTPFRLRLGVKGDNDYFVTISSDGISEIEYADPSSS